MPVERIVRHRVDRGFQRRVRRLRQRVVDFLVVQLGSGSSGDPGGPPTPVPARPMVLLFGAAAAVIVARKRFSRPALA